MKSERKVEQKDDAGEMQASKKNKGLKIGGVLLVLFILIYVPSLLHWLSNDNISSDILRIGVIEESFNAEALLARDELVLGPAEKDGQIIPEVKEGERIPAFSTVATISDKTSQSLLAQLKEVDDKIIKAQNENAKKSNFFSADIAKLDDSIGLKVQDIIWECKNNSLTDVSRSEAEIDELMSKKAAIAGGDDEDPNIKSLKQKKIQLEQQINSNTSRITSEISGIVSYAIDGYEKSLTPKSIDKLTLEQFDAIMAKDKVIKTGYGYIESGKPFIKVIKGSTMAVAAILEKDKALVFKAGDKIKVRLNDIGALISGSVTGIYSKSGGRFLITVAIDRCSEQLSVYRKVNVDFIKKSYEGLKVPVKCLYSPENDWSKAKIMLIKANCATERDVVVLCRNDEYAIIESPEDEMIKKTVALYDTYILNPGSVKEGQIILK